MEWQDWGKSLTKIGILDIQNVYQMIASQGVSDTTGHTSSLRLTMQLVNSLVWCDKAILFDEYLPGSEVW